MQGQTKNFEDIGIDERAFRFFPLKQQEKHHPNKPNGNRVYYHGQIQHDDFQKKKLSEFLQYLKVKQQNKYDQKYFNHHMLILFLSANGYKNQQTYKAMNDHIQFKRKYIRDDEGNRIIRYQKDEKVRKLIDSGFFYICGRDHHFRPTIVFNLPKTDLSDTDAILRGIVFVQQEVIQKMFLPGQVECWNIIYDLGGMGITDIPVNALKGAIQQISANYGGRLYKLWMLNCPGTIYFSWKVVKNFLDPITVDKIHIIKKNTDQHLWKLYDKSQIEQKYGGTQPNKTKFYPFKIPKPHIDQSRLISDQKYAQMVQSGFLKNNIIDPKLKKVEKQQQKQEKKLQQIKDQKKAQEKNVMIKTQQVKVPESNQKNIQHEKQQEKAVLQKEQPKKQEKIAEVSIQNQKKQSPKIDKKVDQIQNVKQTQAQKTESKESNQAQIASQQK